jgi:putative ABC transport system permease protein
MLSFLWIEIAWKNLRAEKASFAFSVAGVTVAAMLLAFMLALYSGWSHRVASYVKDVPADVWVVQKGNEQFFQTTLVTDDSLAKVRSTPGVTAVSSMAGRTLKLAKGETRFDALVMGFDADGIGGPLHIKKGSGTPGLGEIVVDDVLARTNGLHIGDELVANERTLKITGISTGGNNMINLMAFVAKDEGQQLLGVPGRENFGLVTTEKGREAEVVAAINRDVEGVSAFESRQFVANSRKLLLHSMLPILLVVLVLAFIVGTVVVALTIYNATREKEHEYGVMKALGTPGKFLFLAVIEQSMLCGLLGFLAGELAVVVASRFAERLVPQFVTLLRWQDALLVLGSVVVMCVLAACLPVRKVMSVDAMRVFKP